MIKTIFIFLICINTCTPVFAITFEESLIKAQKFNKTFKYYELEHKKNVIDFVSKLVGSDLKKDGRDSSLMPTLTFDKNLFEGEGKLKENREADKTLILEGNLGTRSLKRIMNELPELLSNEAKCHHEQSKALSKCIQTYFEYYSASAKSHFIEANYSLRKKILDHYLRKLSLGDSYKLEVLEKEGDLITAASKRKKNILDKKLKEAEFYQQFGFIPNSELSLPTQNFFKSISSLEELEEQALKCNYQLKAAYKKQSVYKSLLISSRLPIDLTFSYKTFFAGYDKSSSLQERHDKRKKKLSLSINVSPGYVVDACQIGTQLKQNAIAIQQSIDDVKIGLKQCWSKLEMSEEELDGCRKIYQTKKNILNMTEQQYKIGKESMLPIFEAQCKLYEAQLSLLQAESEAWINYFELMHSVGKLHFKTLLINDNNSNKVKNLKSKKVLR